MSPLQLIVGLGNPGKEYADTRHNAGAWFVEKLAKEHGATLKENKDFQGLVGTVMLENTKCHLLIPTTYMNNSGRAVSALSHFYKIPASAILVAHDELDLEPGIVRLKFAGGNAGHNGLKDISQHLTPEFLRLRIGIGRPPHKGIEHVLSKPSAAERKMIDESIDRAHGILSHLIKAELDAAMLRLHTEE